MAISDDNISQRQLARWMRPDAHRFLRSDWRRFWKPGQENEPLYRYYERVERKYRPDQLRDWHGRWTADGASRSSIGGSSDKLTAIASRISPTREADCEEQLKFDAVTCRAVGTPSCWRQIMFRYSQCLIGGYIPPIYH